MTAIENAQIKELSKKIDELHDVNKKNSDNIKELTEALLGSPFNRVGMVQKIDDLQIWKSSVEKSMNKSDNHWDLLRKWGALIAWGATVAYEIVMAFIKK